MKHHSFRICWWGRHQQQQKKKKKISRAQNVHNMTSVCACACVHRFDFGLCRVFLRSFLYFSTSFYGFLFYYCVTFYYGVHIYVDRNTLLHSVTHSQTDAQMGKRMKKCEKLTSNNKEREREIELRKKKHTNTLKGVLRLSFPNTCKFTTPFQRIVSHFVPFFFSLIFNLLFSGSMLKRIFFLLLLLLLFVFYFSA